MNIFWHRPQDATKWHAYDERGSSLCRDHAVMGIGRPADATNKRPRKDKCGKCLRRSKGR